MVFTVGATVLALRFYVPIMCAPEFMLSLFIPDDPAAVAAGAPMLRLFFSTYITLGFLIMAITLFQSMGKAMSAAALTVLRQIVFFIPLAYLLPKVGSLGIQGLFLAPVATDLAVLIMAVGMVLYSFSTMPKAASVRQ